MSKRPQQTSNKTYIAKIGNWQKLLVENCAQRNKNISEEELELAAKRTLVRIIFVHMCEKKSLLEKGALEEVLFPRWYEKDDVYECEPLAVQRDRLNWERLNRTVQQRLFKLFDYTYRWNSALFTSFLKSYKLNTAEAGFDKSTSKLKLDDRILKEIIEEVMNL
jgi:hypothetical protein